MRSTVIYFVCIYCTYIGILKIIHRWFLYQIYFSLHLIYSWLECVIVCGLELFLCKLFCVFKPLAVCCFTKVQYKLIFWWYQKAKTMLDVICKEHLVIIKSEQMQHKQNSHKTSLERNTEHIWHQAGEFSQRSHCVVWRGELDITVWRFMCSIR